MVHTLHRANRLLQSDKHLVVVVADLGFLAPNGFPSFIKSAVFRVFQHKSMGEVVTPFESEAHLRRQHHGLASAVKGILRYATDYFEFQF